MFILIKKKTCIIKNFPAQNIPPSLHQNSCTVNSLLITVPWAQLVLPSATPCNEWQTSVGEIQHDLNSTKSKKTQLCIFNCFKAIPYLSVTAQILLAPSLWHLAWLLIPFPGELTFPHLQPLHTDSPLPPPPIPLTNAMVLPSITTLRPYYSSAQLHINSDRQKEKEMIKLTMLFNRPSRAVQNNGVVYYSLASARQISVSGFCFPK